MSSDIHFQEDAASITDPKGFYAAASHADVRKKKDHRLDTGLLFSRPPCSAAGVFTKNAVKAAPVLQCQRILKLDTPVHGIVVNSGNANACTGEQGKKDATAMQKTAEEACLAPADSFFVCSTGRIGDLLPIDSIKEAISSSGEAIRNGATVGSGFAQSILTSDTKPKTCTASFQLDGNQVTVSGVAKGAGMVQPNMATMLAFITTDIQADSNQLQSVLNEVVQSTFNAITVDGDMSTNDTVLILANGQSRCSLNSSSEVLFKEALFKVCDSLADKVVSDGECISKVVELLVKGAASDKDAESIARAIGNSLLVKTSWYGNDPNWGRLMDALGYAEAQIDQEIIDISYEDTAVLVKGTPVPTNKPIWKRIVSEPRFSIKINMNLGEGSFRLRATDLTEGYVNFNMSE